MILLTNGTFYTMDNKRIVNDVLIKDNLIVALGENIKDYKYTKKIDLKGLFVYPGFTDSHIHLIGYGRKLKSNNLNLEKDKSIALSKIKSFYNNENLKIEGYFNIGLTKHDLDLITKTHFTILRHNDYHSYTVNSKVLKHLNIKSTTGIILDDNISNKINSLFETYNKEELYSFAEEAIINLKKLGYTSVHTDDLSYFNSYLETINILDELSLKHKFKINTLIHHSILNDYIKYYPKDNPYLNDIEVKVFYDGTISSKTAYLSENYLNSNTSGTKYINTSTFNSLIKKVRKLNKGLAIHVIGDKALKEVVTALKKHAPSKEKDRIIHASLYKEDINLNNVHIDIQPLFKVTDKKIIKEIIPKEIISYPFKLYNDKTIINSGSDAPVEETNPLLTLYYLSDDLNRYDCIKTYTVNPNLTINKNSGIIKEGYTACFSIFNKDIMEISKEELLSVKLVKTIINGNI